MSAGVKAGSAFVDIAPNVSKFGEALGAGTAGPLAALQEKVSGLFSALGPAGVAVGGVVAGGVAIGGVLLGIGEKWESSFNKIKVQTGATGTAFDGLKDSVKNVLSNTAGTFEQVTDAVDKLYVKTGLTGQPLNDLARQMVNLGRITKTDVGENTQIVTDLFNKWGIATKDMSKEVDVLFKASQGSGVPVAQLVEEAKNATPAFRNFGFSMNDSVAMLGLFDKGGVNSTKVATALNKAFVEFTKEGLNTDQAREHLLALFDNIKSGKGGVETTAEAFKLFGARAGGELISAIKSGKTDFAGFLQQITDGKNGVNDTAKSVSTLGSKFANLKNKVLVALEPVATFVVEKFNYAFGQLLSYLPAVEAALKPLVDAVLAKLVPAFKEFGEYFGQKVAPIIQQAAVDMLPKLQKAVEDTRQIFEKYKPQLIEFGEALKSIGKFILEQVLPAFVQFIGYLTVGFIEGIGVVIVTISVIVDAFKGLKAFVLGIPDAWRSLTSSLNGIFDQIDKFILTLPQKFYDAGIAIVKALANGILSAISFVTDAVGSVLGKVSNMLPHSPAKEGPLSGQGYPLYAGHAIGESLATGISQRVDMVRTASLGMTTAVGRAIGTVNAGGSRSTASRGGGAVNVYPAKGMSEEQVGRIAAAEMDWQARTASR